MTAITLPAFVHWHSTPRTSQNSLLKALFRFQFLGSHHPLPVVTNIPVVDASSFACGVLPKEVVLPPPVV
jgi:hypothetical protein